MVPKRARRVTVRAEKSWAVITSGNFRAATIREITLFVKISSRYCTSPPLWSTSRVWHERDMLWTMEINMCNLFLRVGVFCPSQAPEVCAETISDCIRLITAVLKGEHKGSVILFGFLELIHCKKTVQKTHLCPFSSHARDDRRRKKSSCHQSRKADET